jgi:hypothetical protein
MRLAMGPVKTLRGVFPRWRGLRPKQSVLNHAGQRALPDGRFGSQTMLGQVRAACVGAGYCVADVVRQPALCECRDVRLPPPRTAPRSGEVLTGSSYAA